jgi:hypothetical protein
MPGIPARAVPHLLSVVRTLLQDWESLLMVEVFMQTHLGMHVWHILS